MKWCIKILLAIIFLSQTVSAEEFLIKLNPDSKNFSLLSSFASLSENKKSLHFNNWYVIDIPEQAPLSEDFLQAVERGQVEGLQRNMKYRYALHLSQVHSKKAAKALAELVTLSSFEDFFSAPADNPKFPSQKPTPQKGADPLFKNQWGMKDIGVDPQSKGGEGVVVAVIDTGVDYTHPDLIESLWVNSKEIPGNGKDDDNNGFVDDIYGWDFVSNDNKPYDHRVSVLQMLMGGNPGHGTHCAGNVAAYGHNQKGISGVAPRAKIMSLRFLGEKGQGTTDGAVKSILYAVNNGAQILSNSWGSIGRGQNGEDKALKEAIEYAREKGVLFVAAAGNGDPQTGQGYSNDDNPKAAYPASYDYDHIISVAAIDSSDALGAFSNFGARSVDIGAPGVNVFSTVVTLSENKYNNVVADLSVIGMDKITWDGTSMATPHVAGAAAAYWAQHPHATLKEVRDAILSSAKKTSTLSGKVSSGGKLSVSQMLNQSI